MSARSPRSRTCARVCACACACLHVCVRVCARVCMKAVTAVALSIARGYGGDSWGQVGTSSLVRVCVMGACPIVCCALACVVCARFWRRASCALVWRSVFHVCALEYCGIAAPTRHSERAHAQRHDRITALPRPSRALVNRELDRVGGAPWRLIKGAVDRHGHIRWTRSSIECPSSIEAPH